MKHVSKIFLYSETFGKRISKLYDISIISDICDKSNNDNIFSNVLNYLLKISNYKPHINEYIIYDFK